MVLVENEGIKVGQFEKIFDPQRVAHGFSTRLESLNMSNSLGKGWEKAHSNRKAFLQSLGLKHRTAAWVRQVHGAKVVVIPRAGESAQGPDYSVPVAEADALVTNRRNLPLLIVAADCVPVLLWDPARDVVAAVHAGWRGTLAGVVAEAVRAMEESFGSRPEEIRAGIGPSIGPCCYEVGGEVATAFSEKRPQCRDLLVRRDGAKARLDLWQANRTQLIEGGLLEENIENAEMCTSCNTHLFYSERKEGRPSGRFGAVISLR